MTNQNKLDLWQGIELSQHQLPDQNLPSIKSGGSIPKKHQEVIKALEDFDLEKLTEVLSPSPTRSTFVTKALAENFSVPAADLIFQSGLLKIELLWSELVSSRNVQGLCWLLSSPATIMALENRIGVSHVREAEVRDGLEGQKSLLSSAGPFSQLTNELTPQDYLTVVSRADWGTLLRGGSGVRLEQELFEEIIEASIKPKVPLRLALAALERMFQEDALSPPESEPRYRQQVKRYGPMNIMASISMLEVMDKMAKLPLTDAARVQEIISSSDLLSKIMSDVFNNWPTQDGQMDSHGAAVRKTLKDFPYIRVEELALPSVTRRINGFYYMEPVDNWLDLMILKTASFICQAIANPSPSTDPLYQAVVERMKDRPDLFLAFCNKLPRDQIMATIPRLATDLVNINANGSPVSHLALHANKSVAMVDALMRVRPPLNLHQPCGPVNRSAIDALRSDQKSVHLLSRVELNYTKALKSELKKVSRSARSELPKAPMASNKPKM